VLKYGAISADMRLMFAVNESAPALAHSASFSDELVSNVEALVTSRPVDGEPAPTYPDDLVHLALSNKVELAVRDRLAYRLHQRLPAGQYAVREWPLAPRTQSKRRVDFGVAAAHSLGEDPNSLLKLEHAFELKSVYSFDIDDASTRRCGELKALAVAVNTIGDSKQSIHHASQRFSLLTVTHIACERDARALQLVMPSYRERVRKLCGEAWDPVRRFNPTEKYLAVIDAHKLPKARLICARHCSSDRPIHGAKVSLGYWLFRHD
jgi:hypothetical protein